MAIEHSEFKVDLKKKNGRMMNMLGMREKIALSP